MSNLVLWLCITAALLTFWAVGAYNRLVRLRVKVRKTFATLDEQLVRQAAWVRGCLPESMRNLAQASPIELQNKVTAVWAKLSAASDQFTAALERARSATVVDVPTMASLMLAHEAMHTAWASALTDAVAPGAEPSADRLQAGWIGLLHQAWPLRAAFNEAAQTYNLACAQFPALIIARLAGFRPAGAVTRMDELTDAAAMN
jgi:LemA protein